MTRLNEKADEIAKMIEFSKEKREAQGIDSGAVQADLNWGASKFLEKIFLEAQIIPNTYISEEQLYKYHNDYQNSIGHVNMKRLLDIFWIRIIAGLVEIPRVVYSAARRYKEIRDAETEFTFLVEASENFKDKKNIERNEFIQFHKETESRYGKLISIEKCKALHFLEEKDDKVKIFNVEYNKPIFHFKEDLSFILFLSEQEEEGSKYQMVIDQHKLDSILLSQRSFLPTTPSLEELENQKVFTKIGGRYFVNFSNVDPNYWRILGDKIGSQLWIYLRNSRKYSDVRGLIREWIFKMRFIGELNTSPKFIPTEDIGSLLDGCLHMLFQEKDLLGTEFEIDKLVLSQRRENYAALTNNPKREYPDLTKAANVFQLFRSMEECNDAHHDDLLWMQECRWFINDLIWLIVFYDNDRFYSRIGKLLSECADRPYIVWKTCFYIHYWRPEIIPHLCLNVKLASVAFGLYFKSEISNILSREVSAEISQQVQCDIFELLLASISNQVEVTQLDKAIVVYECLQLISKNKLLLYRNNESELNIEKRKHLQYVFDKMLRLLKKQKIPGMVYDGSGYYQKKLFPSLVADMFELISNQEADLLYPRGVIGLPLVKLEMLTILLDLINSEEYLGQLTEVKAIPSKTLLNEFVSTYTHIFNTIAVKRWNYEIGQIEDSIPIWSTHQKGIDGISWEKWALHLEGENLFSQFLQPELLKLREPNNKWDKYNQFTVDKIRKHLEILILIHFRLRGNQISYKQQGFHIDSAINRLELAISDLIQLYSVDDYSVARVDIFQDRYERAVFGSDEHSLIPIVAKAMNKFEIKTKEKVLQALIKNESLTRCLKLLEFLSSEADIDFIKGLIKSLNVSDYLDSKNYIPEIEVVVTKLAEYDGFIDKAKEALDYWKQRVLSKKDNTEYQITHYRIKLLIAYYEGDEDTILNEPSPGVDSFSTSSGFEFKPLETRDFYLGLIKLRKNDPGTAHKIFNTVINTSKNDKPALAINRFYAHISMALKTDTVEDKEKTLSAALAEWELYEGSLKADTRQEILEYVKENIWINKLTIYHHLKRGYEFDSLFSSMEKHFQLRKDFFELRVKNFTDRQQYEQAKHLLSEAKQYHQLKDGTLPEFINVIDEQLENEEDYKRLRKEYQSLITRSPEKLIEILPENLVYKRTLSSYVLAEICGSVNDILDTINSIEAINKEDKYTDLLLLSLQSKFRNWYWNVGNSRGGFSASNKRNNGELDFIIRAANNDRIATCEAILSHGKNTGLVSSHTVKTFNYDHRRKLFFIIVYYNGDNFRSHWNDYRATIVPTIKYPDEFPLSDSIEEITEPFTNNSLRALLAKHGDHTEIYHLFVNLNYKTTI